MKVRLGIACLLLIACTPRATTVAIRDSRTRSPAVAIRAVTVVDVPGHHDSCYKPPYVGRLAAVLAERLRGADVD